MHDFVTQRCVLPKVDPGTLQSSALPRTLEPQRMSSRRMNSTSQNGSVLLTKLNLWHRPSALHAHTPWFVASTWVANKRRSSAEEVQRVRSTSQVRMNSLPSHGIGESDWAGAGNPCPKTMESEVVSNSQAGDKLELRAGGIQSFAWKARAHASIEYTGPFRSYRHRIRTNRRSM